jgi:16S rRNA (cytosine967-C5)-methyltransferase
MRQRALSIARRTLEAVEPGRRGTAKAALDEALEGHAGPDAAIASELVYGVVRRRRTLRSALGSVARRAFKGRSIDVELALEIGAYVLVYTDEAFEPEPFVKLVGGGRKAKERVRGALERLAELVVARVDPREAPGALDEGRALPLARDRVLLFRKPVLELANASPARRLALLHSYPDDLARAWVERFGEETAARLCFAGNDPPPLFARANALRTTPEKLVERLAAEGIRARVHPPTAPASVLLEEGRGRFRGSAAFKEGHFTIQDATAQEAAALLAPREGERVLDLCAAPGGKTTHLAELSGDRASILACDVSARRLQKVTQTARRLGLASIATRPLDARKQGVLGAETFDAVLADAPCSNTGVLRRRPEARWRYSPVSQRKIVDRQAAILLTALAAVRPGGRLVWSVCSIEREEGEDLVSRIAGEVGGFEVVESRLRLPEPDGGDGGWLALLSRR